MGGTTGVEYEVVANRVRVLRDLVDEFLDDVHPVLLSTRDKQDTSRWTDLPECAGFRHQYLASIDAAGANLRAVWNDIVGLANNLKAAADALSTNDDEVHQKLQEILARLNAGAPTEYALAPDGTVQEHYYDVGDGYPEGSGTSFTSGNTDEVGQSGV